MEFPAKVIVRTTPEFTEVPFPYEANVDMGFGIAYTAPFRVLSESGVRKLRAAGYRDHIAFVEYHFPEIDVIEACPGDILVIDADEGLALGVMQGAAGVYVPTPRGVGLVPRSAVIRAFRI